MSRKALVIIILTIVAIVFFTYRYLFSPMAETGGLKIASNPPATIFLNDKLIGKTPYEDKLAAGEYVLKLIPQDTSSSASSWQGKITVNPSVLTYVNRELGTSELTSAGESLTLEKISQDKAQLVVFSQPDGATVLIDGQEEKVTPLNIPDLPTGEHDVAVASPGFVSRTVRVLTTPGYKLVVNFQLALAEGHELLLSEGTPVPGEEEPSRPYVLINDTPTGFLRVRSGPSTANSEITQVKPGEKYPFLDEDKGWYKISYEEDKEGWVSGRYAEKVE